MLEKILLISGKSGLFNLVSQGKGMLIVEGLADKRRIPVYSRDRVVSLKDISMYTTEEDMPLEEILEKVITKYEGKPIDITNIKNDDELRDRLGEVLPNFDRKNVYPKDIRKLFNWYNILIENGYTSFVDKD